MIGEPLGPYKIIEATRRRRSPAWWGVAIVAFAFASFAWAQSNQDAVPPASNPSERPNILLIVADDLGYADLGAYGSDIRTPNIDSLAAAGMLFTQFHVSTSCAPSRAMLLSGNNNHVAGVGRQAPSRIMRENIRGYEGHLSDRIAAMPALLQQAGYRTYMAGKWHLGITTENSPKEAGFDRSFGLVGGGANHFSSTNWTARGARYWEDGVEVEYPEGAYSTELYTDRLIEFIDAERDGDRPFFAYAAYTSPHWPLQVPEDYLDLYRGRYDQGYDVLREQRFESLKEAGIIPPASVPAHRNEAVALWDDLDPEQQRREARKMELYAAMVENLDGHVGRLIEYLRANDLFDDTLIVFMSDNGAAHEDFYNGQRRRFMQEAYDNTYENMGRTSSWVSYGAQWAEASTAPFSRHKYHTREGGIVAPLIVAGPGVAGAGTINTAYLTIMDMAPTFLEIVGAEYPAAPIRPMLGESLVDVLAGDAVRAHGDDYETAMFSSGRAMYRRSKWKIVTIERPFAERHFELFDIEADPGETTNLADREPGIYAEMIRGWRAMRIRLGIVLPGDI